MKTRKYKLTKKFKTLRHHVSYVLYRTQKDTELRGDKYLNLKQEELPIIELTRNKFNIFVELLSRYNGLQHRV